MRLFAIRYFLVEPELLTRIGTEDIHYCYASYDDEMEQLSTYAAYSNKLVEVTGKIYSSD